MKPRTGDEDHLRALLNEWKLDVALPPRFQETVWRRIARADAERQPNLFDRMLWLINVTLPRPKVALSFVTLILFLGVAGGAITAQLQSKHLKTVLGQRYLQSVDPYRAVGVPL